MYFFQAEDGIRDIGVTGVQTCALPICNSLGGTVALRAAEGPGLHGVLAVAPAGLDMARWFFLVRRDPLLRPLLASPLPVPGRSAARRVGKECRSRWSPYP